MKRNLLLLFLSLPIFAFAQQQEVFRVDSLPREGVLLNKGWKWHAGDNLEWAKPEFDDAGWQSTNLLEVTDSFPQKIRLSDIRWIRLKLSIKKSILQKEVLGLAFLQFGASEVYLNGKLLKKYGVVSSNPEEVKAFNPVGDPLTLSITKDSTIVLAVRYAFQSNIPTFFFDYSNLIGPRITLNTQEALFSSKTFNLVRYYNSNVFRIGAFLILFISYFALFLYYPVKKENLYFCLFALSLLVADLIQLKIYNNHWVAESSILNVLFFFIMGVSKVFLLTAVYLLLNQKPKWLYWLLSSLILVGFILDFVFYHPLIVIASVHVFPNLVNLEIVRITLKSIQLKKKGAWIIAFGGIVFLIFVVLFVLFVYESFIDMPLLGGPQTIGDLVYNLSWLSIPIAIAIYSGLDIALTNRSLQEKLIEVEQLSLEKQQILKDQNENLERQVAERTAELKASQAQLIQSEKLASLGELTAGIAHEIQNPLNFVNNFAEVSTEMLDDMHEELAKGDTTEAITIATDLKTNLQKINHHGQRASSIVKGMLEHSRMGGDAMHRVSTDINALADEYLRLAYHGLRAKDSNFNATIETHFDPDLPKIEVIPQDIGRVLLNLINNAFYAVNQRAALPATPPGQDNVETRHALSLHQHPYQPTVTISTKRLDNAIEISVQDNGNGIPDSIKDKIFQPFFTTKPTGQGTGLGLSLAYDIVTKGHNGSLNLETKENQGTTFTITLNNPLAK